MAQYLNNNEQAKAHRHDQKKRYASRDQLLMQFLFLGLLLHDQSVTSCQLDTQGEAHSLSIVRAIHILSLQVKGREILDRIPHLCDECIRPVEDRCILDLESPGEVSLGDGQGCGESSCLSFRTFSLW